MIENKTIPSQLMKRFTICFCGITLINLSVSALAFGKDVFLSFSIIMLIVSPFQYLIVFMLFYFHNNSLRHMVDRAEAGKATEEDERFMRGYSIKSALLIVCGSLLAFVGMVIVSKLRGSILSGAQKGLLFTLGTSAAIIMAALFFYMAKIRLYFLGNKVNYKPLNMLQKMAIPILSTILVLFSLASIGFYRISVRQVSKMRTSIIEATVGKNVNFMDGYFNSILGAIKGHTEHETIRSMNLDRQEALLRRLNSSRDESKVELYFTADARGNSVNSLGVRVNIADREYFKRAMQEKRYTMSEPVKSKATGNEVIACAVPVMDGQNVLGVMGATIRLDALENLFKSDKTAESGRYMILDKAGSILLHTDRALIGKSFANFPDDGKKFRDVKNLVDSNEGVIFSYLFNGIESFSFKQRVPAMDAFLIFSMDKDQFLQEVNFVVVEIVLALIGLAIITFFIIYRIAMNFSKPISNMTNIIQKLADGDLTAQNTDFLADEFGEMIRNFKIFQSRLKEIIERALDAAVQLSSSAEELAATSSTLSEGAQSQAASVEEASASIEEVSGSIELINNNAGEQADLAKATYASMEELKKDNETVAGYANQALSAARSTTDQANTGRGLMESTIEGMNNIDDSTKKIADMVSLISDISDQVNLLALNASIEAARAGEHGKGFAVVAEEISKLADETASSAKNITQFVKTGLQEVNRGRQYVDATSGALNNIIDYITQTEELVRKITESAESQAQSSQVVLGDTRKVMEMAESISSSTNEQMLTNQEMSKTVEQINQNTQSSAAAAEQIASSAEEISAQAESLRQQMQFFRV